jgi:alkylation response protein AidB-like acyl-CoA dehydrogenase
MPMVELRTPLRDMRFVLYDVLGFEPHLGSLVDREPLDAALLDAILDGAAQFAENELWPLNASGDREGCRLVDGQVQTPTGFKEAWQTFVASGWSGMVGDAAYGGQGLPHSVGALVEEILSTANMAWTMYPELSHGAMNALDLHGTKEQKQRFLTPLLRGEATGTMCLTEPHAGSDVGLLRTRAVPNADGTYAVSGTKIFISAGDHDFVDNIFHLVLARLPEAPEGTKGISLFVVPKRKLEADGSPGAPNGVSCGALEEKMGIHGNATCVLNFDEATGYLIGAEHDGMRCMFTMMNAARIIVGVQGMGCAEAGYQQALAYARERLQMRALSGPRNPDGPADPIIVHPDVRRMLLTQKALVEGGRALAYYTIQQADLAEFGADDATRQAADAMLDFLTPITKAFLTETGFESVNHALQCFGGHGFINETGVEQLVRDARITLIYEGSTQIQALDLLGRKVLMTQGQALLVFLGLMQDAAAECAGPFPELGEKLRSCADEWGELALGIGTKAQKDPDEMGAASVDFLMYSGYAALAYFWARMALAARAQLERAGGDAFLEGKVATARFFFSRLLPRAEAHRQAALAGADSLMSLDPDGF